MNRLCRLIHTSPNTALLPLSLVVVLIAVMCVPRMALADGDKSSKTEARTLFDRGVHLMRLGRHAEACSKFEASLAHFDGVGTRGKLAECYEKLGRIASAWRLYRQIRDLSKGAKAKRRRVFANKRLEALSSRLPRLTIIVGDNIDIPGFQVKNNGRPVAAIELGLAFPVDPGTQTISATAPDYQAQRITVRLQEGETISISLKPMAPSTDAPASEQQPDGVAASPKKDRLARGGTSTTRIAGYGLMGLGAAGLLAGAYFGGSAYRDSRELSDTCRADPMACVGDEPAIYDRARDNATRSDYTFLAGGALVLVGGTLWLLSRPKRRAPDKRTSVTPTLTPRGVGWAITGRF